MIAHFYVDQTVMLIIGSILYRFPDLKYYKNLIRHVTMMKGACGRAR